MENTWAEVGKDCICIRQEWLRYAGLIGLLMNVAERVEPAPKFMQQYKITGIEIVGDEGTGHRVKLNFAEFPGERWCACGFRPLEKIEDEEHKDTTAPVDLEKV
jgi:hypothetical protein